MPMANFSGQTVLITGASSGIGEAMVRLLMPQRVTLLLVARSQDKLERLAGGARKAGSAAHVYALDLSTPDAARTLHERTTADGHTVDLLVNNAGFGLTGRFERQDLERLVAMTLLNVTALTSLTHRYGAEMRARRRGAVLNVASTAAYQPTPYMSVYGATKHYVRAFSEALHEEWKGSGVTVTCLSPGATQTQFGERADMDPSFFARGETPEQVARVGLDAVARGRRTVISGAQNALMANVSRLLPSGVSAPIAARLFAPDDDES
jgi:short-subunit dehydrogenase